MNPLLVVAGNLVVDDVVFEDGSTRFQQAGGAALYAALGAGLWGIPVGIASIVGHDYPEEVLSTVSAKGIDLEGVQRLDEPNLRIWLLYEGRRRQVVHQLESPPHENMSPSFRDLPAGWQPAAVHLAPMPIKTQMKWLESLESYSSGASDHNASSVLVSLDLFDLIDEDSLPLLEPAFRKADLVLLSEDEVLLDEALEFPERCLARLAGGRDARRPARLLLKRGARGGLTYDRNRQTVTSWDPRVGSIVEPTGAGDAFAGGLLAGLLRDRPFEQAVEQAIVSASFALEGRGADGLLAATPADCAARSRDWFGRG